MLLRIVPLMAVALTIAALLTTSAWRPVHKDGLYAPSHGVAGLF